MTDDATHRELREHLGVHVLGLLPESESVRVRAHLDGCAACRAEVADLQPLAADLRLVDPERLPGPAAPPRALGPRVLAAVQRESVLRDARERREGRRRRARSVLVPLAAAVVAAVAAGAVVHRFEAGQRSPDTVVAAPTAPAVRVERLPLTVLDAAVRAADPAVVVPHTWGVEVTFTAAGFQAGRTYRALVRTADGRAQAAGEFLGVGGGELECDMQAAVLRSDARRFEVVDDSGGTVLVLDLPTA